jgi:hypothetical protein
MHKALGSAVLKKRNGNGGQKREEGTLFNC